LTRWAERFFASNNPAIAIPTPTSSQKSNGRPATVLSANGTPGSARAAESLPGLDEPLPAAGPALPRAPDPLLPVDRDDDGDPDGTPDVRCVVTSICGRPLESTPP
jgi:hypothetical protein